MRISHLHLDQIPRVLTERSQWVGFKVTNKGKTPCVADSPKQKASSTNPKTWRPFHVACDGFKRGMFNALAYALDGDFIGIDLDDCFLESELAPHAADIVSHCQSYTERSFSGDGIHILLAGSLPDGKGRKRNGIEMYERKRFFICTGDRLPNAPTEIRANPAALSWLLGSVTETTETTEAICSVVSALSVVSVTHSPSEVILMTTPKRPGERNRKLLDLARGFRFNAGMANLPLRELKPFLRQWHERALPIIDTKDFAETWSDFVHAWPKARVPLGVDVLTQAWQRAQTAPPPAAATDYDSAPVRRLVGLCAALGDFSPDRRFFLSMHAAAKLLGESHMQVGRWLKMLQADGVIELVRTGNARRASRYRWTAPNDEGKAISRAREGNV